MAKKILLAEDSLTMQKVIEMTLAGEDVVLTAASSVDEAMAHLDQERHDLVLADLSLPRKNGYDLCTAVKRKDGSIPVILLHGSAAPLDAQRARTVGADGDVGKPFETQVLIDRVQELLAAAPHLGLQGPVESLAPPMGSFDADIDIGLADEPPTTVSPPPPGWGRPVSSPAVATPPKAAAPMPRAAAPRPSAGMPSVTHAASARPVPPVAHVPPVARPIPKPIPVPGVERPTAAPMRPAATASPLQSAVIPPRPAAVSSTGTPRAAEIMIEAEPPPPTAPEPLPSFSVGAAGTSARVGTEPSVRTVRPMQTFVGMGAPDPGLPPPPAGMSLPPAGADRRPSQSALRSVPSAGIDPAVYEAIVRLSREVVERVVWEVVPDLAEQIIREQLDRLVEKRGR